MPFMRRPSSVGATGWHSCRVWISQSSHVVTSPLVPTNIRRRTAARRVVLALGRGVVAFVCLAGFSTAPSYGQTAASTGTLSGRVIDAAGGTVQGATLIATPQPNGAPATALTDGDGRYRFAELSPGRYRVVAGSTGFAPAESLVDITAGSSQTWDVTLAVEGVTESLLVVGRNYRVTATPTATKTETPLIRVPQSVQIVPSQIIADQRPLILSDALRNVSGVSSLRNSAEVFRSFNIRGFSTLDMSVDGLRNTYGLDAQPDAVANIERLEVLKGPAAALYGRGGLGGTINLMTKSPERTRSAAIAVSTGSWGLFEPTIDVTGGLNASGSIRARAIIDYENRDTPIDFVSVERLQVAPAVEFDLGSRTVLQIKSDYRKREGIRFVALPTYGTLTGLADLSLPYSLFIGEPGAGTTKSDGWQTTARIDRQFTGTWKAIAAVRWTDVTFDMPSVGPRTLGADNRTLTRRYTRFDDTEREAALEGWVSGAMSTGPVKHTIVIGADWSRFEYDSQFSSGSVASLNIASPTYGQAITGVFLLDHTLDRIGGGGVYAQDQMTFGSRFEVLFGARFDRVDKTREYLLEERVATRDDNAVSPRVGASVLVRQGVALFGCYSEGLVGVADGTANQTGRPFGPQQGDQWEGGVKFDLADTLSLTVAGYQLTRTGGLVTDPNDAAFQIQTGEQRSRGFELDAAWQASRGLSFIANYGYTDAEVTQDTTIRVGSVLMNVPRHAGRVWAKYALPSHGLGSFAVAGGVTAQGDQQGNVQNTLTIPANWVTDLGLVLGAKPHRRAVERREPL
jgi:iron complex outermembrane receptor protein